MYFAMDNTVHVEIKIEEILSYYSAYEQTFCTSE